METIIKLNEETLEIETTTSSKRKITKKELLARKQKIDDLLDYFN